MFNAGAALSILKLAVSFLALLALLALSSAGSFCNLAFPRASFALRIKGVCILT